MSFPFLIAGLILLLAGRTWFTGATTVGWICICVTLAEAVIWAIVAIAAMTVSERDLRRRRRRRW